MMKKIGVLALVVVGLAVMAFSATKKNLENQGTEEVTAINVYKPVVVLELFTSQGCSSCPSADALLGKVKEQEGEEVFTLSYHVDYWNYIGWEDPFSQSKFTDKQRLYNIKFRNRSNYTPQVVVNGREHFVGSSSTKMNAALAAYKRRKSANEIRLEDIQSDTKGVEFTYEVEGDIGGKNLRALLVLDERTTEVKRGENRNRTLTNANIVVGEKEVSLQSKAGVLKLEFPKLVLPKEKLELIVLVESETYDITAAAKKDLVR